MIKFEDFKKLDIRIGKVLSAENITGSEKLLKLEVDIGKEIRQIVAGMAGFYQAEYFIGKNLVVLTNLEPKEFMGIESQGMILAVDVDGKPILLLPEKEVPAGSVVR